MSLTFNRDKITVRKNACPYLMDGNTMCNINNKNMK